MVPRICFMRPMPLPHSTAWTLGMKAKIKSVRLGLQYQSCLTSHARIEMPPWCIPWCIVYHSSSLCPWSIKISILKCLKALLLRRSCSFVVERMLYIQQDPGSICHLSPQLNAPWYQSTRKFQGNCYILFGVSLSILVFKLTHKTWVNFSTQPSKGDSNPPPPPPAHSWLSNRSGHTSSAQTVASLRHLLPGVREDSVVSPPHDKNNN